jgi:hypothetical protein
MTDSEKEILNLLGFKECRLNVCKRGTLAYSKNGFIVTKHSYYWNVRGNFPYKLCKSYEDDKNIRFNGSGNKSYNFATSNDYDEFAKIVYQKYKIKELTLEEGNVRCEEYKKTHIDNGDFYIEDLHIDSQDAFIRVAKDIDNLMMVW